MNNALIRVTGQHHDPAGNDHLSKLVALADFIGGAAYPFPVQGQYPVAELLNGDGGGDGTKIVEEFLPEGLLEQFNMEAAEFIGLGRAILPAVRLATERLREIA